MNVINLKAINDNLLRDQIYLLQRLTDTEEIFSCFAMINACLCVKVKEKEVPLEQSLKDRLLAFNPQRASPALRRLVDGVKKLADVLSSGVGPIVQLCPPFQWQIELSLVERQIEKDLERWPTLATDNFLDRAFLLCSIGRNLSFFSWPSIAAGMHTSLPMYQAILALSHPDPLLNQYIQLVKKKASENLQGEDLCLLDRQIEEFWIFCQIQYIIRAALPSDEPMNALFTLEFRCKELLLLGCTEFPQHLKDAISSLDQPAIIVKPMQELASFFSGENSVDRIKVLMTAYNEKMLAGCPPSLG